MPWVVTPQGAPAGFGRAYPSQRAALDAREPGTEIAFDATPDEREEWQARERERFTNGTYTAVPWFERLQQIAGLLPAERIDTESGARADCGTFETFTEEHSEGARAMLAHFAHISTSHQGQVAYTPTDQHGIQDRQIRTTADRYLQCFAPAVLDDLDALAGEVRALTGAGFGIARTEEEIGRVYASTSHCFESCMDGRNYPDWEEHPARVYAGPDLAVAYVGKLHPTDCSHNELRARVVIWPAKKYYHRIFGDVSTIRGALEALGYRQGSLEGARIQAVEDGGGYVMPYVDWLESADLSRGGEYLVLRADCDGEYGTQTTSGCTDESGRNYCERCEERCGRNRNWCVDCEDGVYCCERCSNHYHQDDTDRHAHDYGTLCDDCHENQRRTCEGCEEDYNLYDFRDNARRDRELCDDCDGRMARCVDCDTYTDTDDLDAAGRCTGCHVDTAADRRARRLFPPRRWPRGAGRPVPVSAGGAR